MMPVSCGVPQGSVLGPLLFLIYVSDIPCVVEGYAFQVHQFADDILIYGSGSPTSINIMSNRLSSCIDGVNAWLKRNRLVLNPSKSNIMWCASPRCKFSVPSFPIRVCDVMLVPSTKIRYLGVIIDSGLSFNFNISRTVSTCFGILRCIKSIRHSLTSAATKTLVSALVLPRLDYCISTHCGLPLVSLNRLQRILHAAARLVFNCHPCNRMSPLLRRLEWLPVQGRIQRRIGILTFRCLQGSLPSYLASNLQLASSIQGRRKLRSANTRSLCIPPYRRPSFGARSFDVFAAKFWNDLTPNIRTIDSFNDFLKHLTQFLTNFYL